MKKNQTVKMFLLLGTVFFILGACSLPSKEKSAGVSSSEKHAEQQLLIAAAASLESVFEQKIIPAFEKEYPKVTIKGNYDSSGKLQAQIENGLDADIFFSAATKQMDALVSQKLIEEKTVVPLLKNKLVMIVPIASKETLTNFSDLTKMDMIAIGDPASVPAGQYAEKALKKLGSWAYVKNHASLGTNVTEVLNWVAEGSAPVGLVYVTDAMSNDQVKVVAELPEDVLDEPIIYPVAPLKSSQEKAIVNEFLIFLQKEEVATYFEEAGFTVESD